MSFASGSYFERFADKDLTVAPDYGIVVERTVDCEAELYGYECYNSGRYALIRLPHSGNVVEGDYIEGFHVAHLCSEHALAILQLSEVEGKRRKAHAKELEGTGAQE